MNFKTINPQQGAFGFFFCPRRKKFSFQNPAKLACLSARVDSNNFFSLRVKKGKKLHTQAAAQLANHGKLKLAGLSATPSYLTLESATALNA